MALRLFRTKDKTDDRRSQPQVRPGKYAGADEFVPAKVETPDPDPLKWAFQQGRYNQILLDRERWRDHKDAETIFKQAASRLDKQMLLVPEGRATVHRVLNAADDDGADHFEVPPFLLDTCAVTNARFQAFVDASAYEDLSLWPESIWPHLIQMRDQTGKAGPRFWRDGRHNAQLSNHPVVGVSWFEAMAYARWIGQRLPTEAEWQMAASWRIKSETDVLYRFPWGDAMDRKKCNIWASGLGRTAPVDQYKNGAAPNGVLQLVGNTWEWVDSDLDLVTEEGVAIVGEMTMKVTRGGAFDTYFESQATSLFRTGHNALTRIHNVGFRCALSLEDAPAFNEQS